MENVISFTPAELIAFITAIGGAIVTIGAVVTLIVKLFTKLRAPEKRQDERITNLEKDVTDLKARLNDGNDKFKSIEESNIVILSTLRALLKHAVNGNDIKALKDAEKDLDKFLITK